jgi:hypothetical protein
LDAFIGERSGGTFYFENTGSSSAPAFGASQINPFGLADVEDSASPAFADLDGDGDLDAFIGELGGNTVYCENIPVAMLSTAASTVSGPFVIDISFSEDVSGLLPMELVITNARFSNATTVDGANYQLTLTPIKGGDVTISLPADQAQSTANGTGNAASNTLVVFFNGLVEPCTPGAGDAANDWIQRVILNDGSSDILDSNSGNDGGYANFDGLGAVTLTPSAAYTARIEAGRSANTRLEAYRIWIDYNRDGDFNDAGEEAFSRNLTDKVAVQGIFTVPFDAQSGLTRMRVQMKHAQVPFSPCETLPFGETEDYLMEIGAPSGLQASRLGRGVSKGLLEDASEASLSVYPNPASGTAQVQFEGDATVELLSLDGRVLRHVQASGTHQLDLSDLPSGLYVIAVTDAQGNRQTVKLAVE